MDHLYYEVPFPLTSAPNTERIKDIRAKDDVDEPLREENTGHITYVPGNPAVKLHVFEVDAFLSKQLETPVLDDLYQWLWLFAKQSSQNIKPLSRHRVKGRSIIPTEDPRLHLIWQPNKIYVKTVPECLLNYQFWATYLTGPRTHSDARITQDAPSLKTCPTYRSLAMGFLRSYALLVPHRLDFQIAKEYFLIPDYINWIQWSKFINFFRQIRDENVAQRYHYGQLRLSRLNWAVRLFRPHHASTNLFYETPLWSTGRFLSRATVPLLFVFACMSLILSSMQVALSVPTEYQPVSSTAQNAMGYVFWTFSIIALLLSAVILVILLGIPLAVLTFQLSWGFRHRKSKEVTI